MTVQTEPAAKGFAVPAAKRKLEIRQVWAHNVEYEFWLIRQAVEQYPYVAVDTEFPGVIHHHDPARHHTDLTPSERYALLRANVDALHLVQVGLAFAASPDAPPAVAFQINLREFDPLLHRHNPSSVALLAAHGLDFAAHREHGVDARVLAAHLMSSGLVCNGGAVTWAAFQSSYDFGYLVKLLMGRKLPRALPEFLALVRVFFGAEVYDVRHIMDRCPGLRGGLDAVAAALGAPREAGRAHQAGSDSAVTWDAFRRVRQVYFAKEGVRGFAGVIYGLDPRRDLAVGNAVAGGAREGVRGFAGVSYGLDLKRDLAAGVANGVAGEEKKKYGGFSAPAAARAGTGNGNGGRRGHYRVARNNRAVSAVRA